jgi:hypothetical protein
MDKILEKHLANALVLVKSDLNISIPDENIIPYDTCILEDNKYEIKTEFDIIKSDIVGYWKDKPIISYNRTKYAILENSNTIVKLKSLNVTDDKIRNEPEKVKNLISLILPFDLLSASFILRIVPSVNVPTFSCPVINPAFKQSTHISVFGKGCRMLAHESSGFTSTLNASVSSASCLAG